jgi:hypothetical protein
MPGQLAQHPRPEDDQRDCRHHQLRYEGQRHFLHLGDHLDDAHQEADGHGQAEHRQAGEQAGGKQARHHFQCEVWVHSASRQ